MTGGRVKCQWKADWAMRWTALGVDYEMAGKDLIESVTLSSKICKALGGVPPEGFNYELFLDDKGEKISKSKGNGLTIDEWLRYATPESLSLFMFQKPKTAKRLYFDVIPRAVDEYLQLLAAYPRQDGKANGSTIRSGTSTPASRRLPSCRHVRLLLNLVVGVERGRQGGAVGLHPPPCRPACDGAGASAARPARRLRGALLRGLREAAQEGSARPTRSRREALARAVGRARQGRSRRERRRAADASSTTSAAPIPRYQDLKAPRARALRSPASPTRGSPRSTRSCSARRRGPRFGSFIELYGIDETRALIDKALERRAAPRPRKGWRRSGDVAAQRHAHALLPRARLAARPNRPPRCRG